MSILSLSRDDTTRLSLYRKWANAAEYFNDTKAASLWQSKCDDLLGALPMRQSPSADVVAIKTAAALSPEWTKHEDGILIDGVARGESYDWIGKRVGRTRVACIGRARRKGWTFDQLVQKGVVKAKLNQSIGA